MKGNRMEKKEKKTYGNKRKKIKHSLDLKVTRSILTRATRSVA
jgi:hypothetical protein